jgi:DNA-binding Lrp family transcriptional regulator
MERIITYHKIYSQIYDFPTISVSDIASHTGLSRNTVTRYLKEMYTKGILLGPHIRMKPAPNYTEYVYLMNFQDPYKVFRGLKEFPHVLYHAMTFGDWNTLIITNRLLDFTKLRGFQSLLNRGTRGYSYTPYVGCISWNESFKKMYSRIEPFTPLPKYEARTPPPLTWEEDDWTLFCTFKYSMRRKVTPAIRKINVRYETYSEWMNTLQDHCTIHTGFYPEGYHNYLCYCFLFHTDHPQSVQSLLSFLPTTPFIMELPDQLLIFVNVISPDITRNLFCTIYDMKTNHIIREFSHAVALFHGYH